MAIEKDIASADQHIEERPDIESQIIESLSQTPYSCLSLKQLSGGLGNFTFRGSLCSPLPDNRRTVIVKHSLQYEKTGTLDLPVTRCTAEAASLGIMRGSLFKHANVSIRSPHHLHLDKDTNLRVMEDIPNCGTLRDYLYLNKGFSNSEAMNVGQALGRWLSEFHSRDWSHIDEEVAATLRKNAAALRVSQVPFKLTMDAFHEDPMARESVLKAFSGDTAEHTTIIHGDFSTRNLLLESPQDGNKQNNIDLALVDWEICRYGCVTMDLASMIACLYIQWHFEDTLSAEYMLRGFIRGYGKLSEELIFRTAGITAIVFVMWGKLGGMIGEKTEARVCELYQHAKKFLIGAAQKDGKWLSQSVLSEFSQN